MSHDGVGLRSVMRSVSFLTAGALAVSVLAGCSSEDQAGKPLAGQDIAPAARARVADGGTLRWAVDAVPETLNTFQSDADAATGRIAQAVLPSMYRLNENGRPERNPDYLESAKVVETEPKQVVLYKLNQQAVWSDGREIGAADFAAQWRALSGKDTAYWTARNAGYDRIEKVERGANDLEVRVTFGRPYTDWRSLFSPLYPKDVMGTPDAFNDGARRKLKVTAGPFALKKVDRKDDEVTLARSPRWWGQPAKLTEIVLRAVPRDKRAAALAAGTIDLAELDPESAGRVTLAARAAGKGTSTPSRARPAAKRPPRTRAGRRPSPASSSASRWSPPTPSSPSTAPTARSPTSVSAGPSPGPWTGRRSRRPSSSRSGCPPSRSAATSRCPGRPTTPTTAAPSAGRTPRRRGRCSPTPGGCPAGRSRSRRRARRRPAPRGRRRPGRPRRPRTGRRRTRTGRTSSARTTRRPTRPTGRRSTRRAGRRRARNSASTSPRTAGSTRTS